MRQIAPSILSADFANLAQNCRDVLLPENKLLHIDVMDGVFVPNITLGPVVLSSLTKAVPQAIYDVHLMIVDPGKYIEDFAKAGAHIITFHIEAEGDPVAIVKKIHDSGRKAGVSLRPGTPMEALLPVLDIVDMVLVMSVEPGFGGQKFMPEAIERIRWLRETDKTRETPLYIEVDGGINMETAPLCIEAGADILVAGSAVFGAPNPAEAVRALRGPMEV